MPASGRLLRFAVCNRARFVLTTRFMSAMSDSHASSTSTAAPAQAAYQYDTLAISSPKPFVLLVELNRPTKANAMNSTFWREVRECFYRASDDSDVRAIVLAARGKVFTAGLDLTDLAVGGNGLFDTSLELTRRARLISSFIGQYQESFSAIEKCPKPVIAAIHGACVGGGVDMVSACDIRYATHDAFVQIKEVDLGLAADVGTLQRLPKAVGNDSFVREAAYSARKVPATEALTVGFVSRLFQDQPSMLSAAIDMAAVIASKSPVAVQGTKISLVYSRDHPVADSLDHIRQYNQYALQSEDLLKAAQAAMKQGPDVPVFSKL